MTIISYNITTVLMIIVIAYIDVITGIAISITFNFISIIIIIATIIVTIIITIIIILIMNIIFMMQVIFINVAAASPFCWDLLTE